MALRYPPSKNAIQKTLDGALLTGVTAAATLNNVDGIQNLPGVFVVDRIDANGVSTPSKREYCSFAATGGVTLITIGRGLAGSSDQDHTVGAIVEFIPDVVWAQAINDVITAEHSTAGVHDTTKVITHTATQTLTNKRITKRVVTTTDDATAVIDCAVTDIYELSAVANATEFTVTGTPTDGQPLIIRYKDAGVAKNLTFTGFTAIGVTIPTITTAGKWGVVGAFYNSVGSTWQVLAVSTEA